MPTADALVIREQRHRLGLTVQALAEQSRLTPKALERIESGGRGPSIEAAYRLAGQLRIRPSAIVPGLPDPADARSIRERRRASGVKPRPFAEQVGISVQHLMGVEAGGQNPSPQLLERIAEALGCKPSDLAEPDDDDEVRAA